MHIRALFKIFGRVPQDLVSQIVRVGDKQIGVVLDDNSGQQINCFPETHLASLKRPLCIDNGGYILGCFDDQGSASIGFFEW